MSDYKKRNVFQNQRIVVIGLGKAGTGMARVLKAKGAQVTVVDEKSADSQKLFEPLDEMAKLDIPVITSWTGELEWSEWDGVACSPGVPSKHPTLQEALRRGIPLYSETEIAYRIAESPIIAITGTNGKSTVTALTYWILQKAGKKAILCGNIAGSGYPEYTITEAALNGDTDSILVAEVSSFQLEWISEFRPKAATITQIVEDHLDRYESLREYAATKHKIFRNMKDGDVVVFNTFRPETKPEVPSSARVLKIGAQDEDAQLDAQAQISGQDVYFPQGNTSISLSELWDASPHNLENAATAGLLANVFGVTFSEIREGVLSFRPLRNRMEFLGERNGVRYINNSMCTNPTALKASLEAMDSSTLLLAGGIAKVKDYSMISSVKNRIKKAYLFGRDGAYLKEVFEKMGVKSARFDTLREAFESAQSEAKPRETILLAPSCASFDQFESFMERGELMRKLVEEVVRVG
ncbi:MAG TPA: UDP-N-acetylmuramoyl-L-alanine--D-glutamate ligase [Fimbriimonadales bacterium]|nr:UDP-N-acetylmuramoyl-L-alanine--D-glutamate ligase [Fimbriimonadales bacterium]